MKPVDELSGECLYMKPVNFDWTSRNDERGEPTWTSYSWEECESCSMGILMTQGEGGEAHNQYEDTPCEGHVPLFEGPMMNYWYPLGANHNPDDAAKLRGPVCLVNMDGEWGLALTGGGMDLSWEIVEAFVRLDYLPPLHFCDLPRMCGRGVSPLDRKLLKACRASVVACMRHLRGKLKSLQETKRWSEEYEANRSTKKFAVHP